MLNFTLDDENLIWGFFDELNISHQDLFLEVIQEKLKITIPKDIKNEFLEHFDDDLQDFIGECGIRYSIKAIAIDENEVDEAVGTVGYFEFEIEDEEGVKTSIEQELKSDFANFVKKLNIQGRFNKYK